MKTRLFRHFSLHGFTLIEAVFSFFIVFLILGALATTLNQAAAVKKNTKNMDQTVEEFHALITMKNDALAALSLASPTTGGVSPELRIEKVNPSYSFFDRTDVLRDPLDPFEPDERVLVEYRLDGGLLTRYTSFPESGSTTAEKLLPCESFEAGLNASGNPLLTITFRVKTSRVTKTRAIKVSLKL